MSDNNFRRCAIAPKYHHYSYCPKCGRGNPNTPWKFTFCSENCRDLFDICDKFSHQQIDAKEANELLSKIDLSDIAHFHPSYQEIIADIIAAKPKTRKSKKKIVNDD